MVRLHPRSRPLPAFRRVLFSCLAFLPLAVGAQASTSAARNPTTAFSTPGSKQVTLQACSAAGCTSMTKTVVVLDPKPNILSTNIPLQVGAGQPVLLQAAATGRPALSYRWVFTTAGIDTVLLGATPTWNTPLIPGTFQAHLEVSNADGMASSTPVTVNVVLSTFVDVLPSYWAWKFIENMYQRGIFTECGISPLSFCPEDSVTRGQMALILLRAKNGGAYVPPPCVTAKFSDVPCSDPLAPWVNELVARGVTAGCGGGLYCPNNPVTREQMAVFLLVTKEGPGYSPSPACLSAPFNDVPCFSGFAIWIKELVARGVTAGCGNGSYCPATAVNRAQMSVFVSTAFNLPPP
jgi:hypothetical protein